MVVALLSLCSQLGSEFYASGIHMTMEDKNLPHLFQFANLNFDGGCLELEHGSICFGTAAKPIQRSLPSVLKHRDRRRGADID